MNSQIEVAPATKGTDTQAHPSPPLHTHLEGDNAAGGA